MKEWSDTLKNDLKTRMIESTNLQKKIAALGESAEKAAGYKEKCKERESLLKDSKKELEVVSTKYKEE